MLDVAHDWRVSRQVLARSYSSMSEAVFPRGWGIHAHATVASLAATEGTRCPERTRRATQHDPQRRPASRGVHPGGIECPLARISGVACYAFRRIAEPV